MDVYAAFARFHMKRFGTTQRADRRGRRQEPRPLGAQPAVAIPQRVHRRRGAGGAADHLSADAADVLADHRTAPRRPWCATGARLKRLGIDERRAVRVLASRRAVGQRPRARRGREALHGAGAPSAPTRSRASARPMCRVAEVHDATAMGEIIQIENLGFCAFGDGGAISRARRDRDRRPHPRQSVGRPRIERASDRRDRASGRSTSWSSQLRGEAGAASGRRRAHRARRERRRHSRHRGSGRLHHHPRPADGRARRMGPAATCATSPDMRATSAKPAERVRDLQPALAEGWGPTTRGWEGVVT